MSKKQKIFALVLGVLATLAESQRTFDFIIVGGGTGGCVLANRLSENPNWDILMLESGGLVAAPYNNIPLNTNRLMQYERLNYGFKTEPSDKYCLAMNHRECNVPQGKGLGGSSIFWDMIYSRGNWRDYDSWRDQGNPSWGYEDVMRDYKKFEHNLVTTTKDAGKEGPVTISNVKWRSENAVAFMAAGEEIGMPTVNYNNRNQTGFSYVQAILEDGLRQTTHSMYMGLLAVDSPNLTVRRRATVDRLIIESKGEQKRVTGVVFRMGGVNYTAFARYEVILTAGTINNPKLLLLSGIGPTQHLLDVGIQPILNLPVGQNLMDHVGIGGLTFFSSKKVIDVLTAFGYYSQVGFYYTHDGELSSPGGVEALAFFDSSNSSNLQDGYPDYELMFTSGSIVSMPALRDRHNLNYSIYETMYGDVEDQKEGAYSITPILIRPKSRGEVRLWNSDPRQNPVIAPNYFSDPNDMKVLLIALRKTMELVQTKALQAVVSQYHDDILPLCEQHIFDSDAYWECYIRHFTFSMNHHSGTCKMGPANDSTAVVDAKLKVHGIDGLRIVGASTMPTQITGHPNGAVLMIAEKVADMILAEYPN